MDTLQGTLQEARRVIGADDTEDAGAGINEDDGDGPGPDMPPDCPACNGPGVAMGGLGNRLHYRCRDCGIDFSTDAGAES